MATLFKKEDKVVGRAYRIAECDFETFAYLPTTEEDEDPKILGVKSCTSLVEASEFIDKWHNKSLT